MSSGERYNSIDSITASQEDREDKGGDEREVGDGVSLNNDTNESNVNNNIDNIDNNNNDDSNNEKESSSIPVAYKWSAADILPKFITALYTPTSTSVPLKETKEQTTTLSTTSAIAVDDDPSSVSPEVSQSGNYRQRTSYSSYDWVTESIEDSSNIENEIESSINSIAAAKPTDVQSISGDSNNSAEKGKSNDNEDGSTAGIEETVIGAEMDNTNIQTNVITASTTTISTTTTNTATTVYDNSLSLSTVHALSSLDLLPIDTHQGTDWVTQQSVAAVVDSNDGANNGIVDLGESDIRNSNGNTNHSINGNNGGTSGQSSIFSNVDSSTVFTASTEPEPVDYAQVLESLLPDNPLLDLDLDEIAVQSKSRLRSSQKLSIPSYSYASNNSLYSCTVSNTVIKVGDDIYLSDTSSLKPHLIARILDISKYIPTAAEQANNSTSSSSSQNSLFNLKVQLFVRRDKLPNCVFTGLESERGPLSKDQVLLECRELFLSSVSTTVKSDRFKGKCTIRHKADIKFLSTWITIPNHFYYSLFFDDARQEIQVALVPSTGSLPPHPSIFRRNSIKVYPYEGNGVMRIGDIYHAELPPMDPVKAEENTKRALETISRTLSLPQSSLRPGKRPLDSSSLSSTAVSSIKGNNSSSSSNEINSSGSGSGSGSGSNEVSNYSFNNQKLKREKLITPAEDKSQLLLGFDLDSLSKHYNMSEKELERYLDSARSIMTFANTLAFGSVIKSSNRDMEECIDWSGSHRYLLYSLYILQTAKFDLNLALEQLARSPLPPDSDKVALQMFESCSDHSNNNNNNNSKNNNKNSEEIDSDSEEKSGSKRSIAFSTDHHFWNKEEILKFEKGFALHGKKFHEIRKKYLPHKKPTEITAFYYRWKGSIRHKIWDYETSNGDIPGGDWLTLGWKSYKSSALSAAAAATNSSSSALSKSRSASKLESYTCSHCFTNKSHNWFKDFRDTEARLCSNCRSSYVCYGILPFLS